MTNNKNNLKIIHQNQEKGKWAVGPVPEPKPIPVLAIIYTGVELQINLIIKDNRGKLGVYLWINTETGEFYIGSTANLSKRLTYYFNAKYMSKYRSKSIIYSTLLKNAYGIFKIEILEHCDIKSIISWQQYYINTLKPRYSVLKFAYTSLGSSHSEKTKIQMCLNNTKEKHPFFGKNILKNQS